MICVFCIQWYWK